jgi:hypothetical protein
VSATVELSQSDTPEGLKAAICGRIQALAKIKKIALSMQGPFQRSFSCPAEMVQRGNAPPTRGTLWNVSRSRTNPLNRWRASWPSPPVASQCSPASA